jgi:hypothetical protein
LPADPRPCGAALTRREWRFADHVLRKLAREHRAEIEAAAIDHLIFGLSFRTIGLRS